MSRRLPAPPLLLITDRRSARQDIRRVVGASLAAGCRWVMVREKDLDPEAFAALARPIVADAHAVGATVVVNADPEPARVIGADGVHLPADADIGAARRTLGGDALIGASTHSIGEARRAAAAGADYVTLSPIFLTESKPGYGPALGTGGLHAAVAVVDVPVIALAGVDAGNAASCLAAGAAGIATMGGVMRAVDPAAVVRSLLAAIAPRDRL